MRGLAVSAGLAALATGLALPGVPAIAQDIEAGLVVYYHLEEGSGTSFADSAGSVADNGTIQTGSGAVQGTHWDWVADKFGGYALEFTPVLEAGPTHTNEIGACGVAPMSAEADVCGGSKSYSVACWAMFTDWQHDDGYCSIVGQPGWTNGLVRFQDVPLMTQWDDSGNPAVGWGNNQLHGEWFHLVGVCDATVPSMTLYIDGPEAASQNLTAPLPEQGDKSWRLGANGPDAGGDWGCYANITIDEVRVYNRVLSQAEVTLIHNFIPGVPEATVTADPGVDPAADPDGREDGDVPTGTEDTATFVVLLTDPAVVDIPVNVSVSDTGTPGACDYTVEGVSGGAVTIPNGQSSATITIRPVNDNLEETLQTVTVTIEAATGGEYRLGGVTTADVTVFDDDIDPPGAFNLLDPTGGETVPFDQALTLLWEEPTSTVPLTYDVEVSTDSGFGTLIVDRTGLSLAASGGTVSYQVAAADLTESQQYWWRVTAHNDGGNSSSSTETFQTAADTAAPFVTTTSPGPGSSDADVGTSISLYFSEPVLVTGIDTAVTVSAGVTGSVALTGGDRVIVFTPDVDLAYDTTYTVTVLDGRITDKAVGLNPLDGNAGALSGFQFSFTTQSPLVGLARGKGCLPGARGRARAWLPVALAVLAALLWSTGGLARRRPGRGDR